MKKITGLIPVKGNSERVTDKNLRSFGRSSLFELKLEQLSHTNCFHSIVVSSEDARIRDVAKANGFHTHNRDPKYSTSDVPMSSVYSYIASEVDGDHIAWINVTNPLAGPECYTAAVQKYQELDAQFDCLLSVTESREYMFFDDKPVNFFPNPWPKSQDLKGLYEMNFVINILKNRDMVEWGSCVGSSPYFYVLDRVSAWDIDFPEDFEFCEMIYNSRLKS